MTFWNESIAAGNGRNNIVCAHLTATTVGDTQTTLVSGMWIADYDKVSISFANAHASAAVNFQCWVSNSSGAAQSGTTSPLYASISGGVTWAALGDPVTVAAGNSCAKSWETTVGKYFAVTGSASVAAASAATINVFGKMRA